MPEAGGANIEVTQRLSERKESSQFLGHEILEIVEAVVLPVVCYHYCLERLSGSALDWTLVRTCTGKRANCAFRRRSRRIRQSGAFV